MHYFSFVLPCWVTESRQEASSVIPRGPNGFSVTPEYAPRLAKALQHAIELASSTSSGKLSMAIIFLEAQVELYMVGQRRICRTQTSSRHPLRSQVITLHRSTVTEESHALLRSHHRYVRAVVLRTDALRGK